MWLGLLAAAFIGLYFRWFLKQIEFSLDSPDDWGHSFVVPLISGYMLWQRRKELAAIELKPFLPGICPLVLGIMSYFFFVVGVSNHMLQGLAMLLGLAGMTLLVFGLHVFRIAFLPIAYLIFAITISEQIMIKVTFPLQLFATQGAWLLLKLISIPGNWFFIDAAGNQLTISRGGRTIPLNVAEACSGMRMIIAFIALAGAVAIFSCRQWWQRVAVVALAIPVAVFMNVIRVAVLALASLLNADLAEGNAHMLIGTLLLVPGLMLYLLLVSGLKRLVQEPESKKPVENAQPSLPKPWAHWHAWSTPMIATVALLVSSAAAFGVATVRYKLYLKKEAIYPADGRLMSRIPSETGSWVQVGPDRRETAEVEDVLGTTNYVSRLYYYKKSQDPAKPIIIDFHAAYYTGMIDTVPHVPDRCFVGGGMQLGGVLGDVPLPLDRSLWKQDEDVPEGMTGRIWKVRLPNESERAGSYVRLPRDPEKIELRIMEFFGAEDKPYYAGYFFIANGGTVAKAEGVRLLAFDLKTKHAYYTKLQFTSQSVTSGEELARYAALLLDDIFGEVMLCIPDWVEVEAGRYPAPPANTS